MTKYERARSFLGGAARRQARALWAAVAATSLVACGGEDNFAVVGEAEMVVTPSALTFNAEIGIEDVQYLTISNIGDAELLVTELDLRAGGSTEFNLAGAELPLRIAPGDERQLQVFYMPADCEQDRANLIIHSNDQTEQDGVSVPLQPQTMSGQVLVSPNPIDFGRVPASTNKTLAVRIQNSGNCALFVNDLFITGSEEFDITEDVDGQPVPDLSFEPFTLEPGADHVIDVSYAPQQDGYDEGTLVVRSDDAASREVEVDIVANGDQPCIQVDQEAGIDFGQRFINETHPKTITITNCSNREDLVLDGIELEADAERGGLERYSLADVPEPGLIIPPGGVHGVILNYSPIQYTPENNPDCDGEGCLVTDAAMLVIVSNDEVKSPLAIEVSGVGTNNHCPIAVARARVQGSTGPLDTQVDAIPQNVIEFDGRNSSDPEGTVAAYQWEVVSSPPDNVSTFQPNATIPNPTYEVNVAGQYTFALRVFDDVGVESCDPATVLVVVTPNEHIHVELSWETPADPNRTDTGAGRGSDVDLHFIHPNAGATWNRSPWDCHWQNKTPNWASTSRDDDPSLDRDDTDGWGPENINLNNPEGTEVNPILYGVGVYYFSDHGYGASDVTVRIFLDGVERFARTLPGLTNRQFWDVATIAWPTREIEAIHRLYPSNNLPAYFSSAFP